MKTIYEIGRDGAWTGATQEVGDAELPPKFWTDAEPPQEREPGDLVLWTGAGWVIADIAQAVAYWSSELGPRKEAMRAALRDKRWRVETGGIVVGGASIRTDETSQAKITGAVNLFSHDETLTHIDWEAQPGIWVQLDEATMLAIGVAVGRHVQACFSHAKTLSEAITSAEDHAALDAIDIEAGWPG